MPDNGHVERFAGWIASEVLDINVYPHRAFEQLLRGFHVADDRDDSACWTASH